MYQAQPDNHLVTQLEHHKTVAVPGSVLSRSRVEASPLNCYIATRLSNLSATSVLEAWYCSISGIRIFLRSFILDAMDILRAGLKWSHGVLLGLFSFPVLCGAIVTLPNMYYYYDNRYPAMDL